MWKLFFCLFFVKTKWGNSHTFMAQLCFIRSTGAPSQRTLAWLLLLFLMFVTGCEAQTNTPQSMMWTFVVVFGPSIALKCRGRRKKLFVVTQIGYFNGKLLEFLHHCSSKSPKFLVVCLCSGRLKVVYWLWSISFSNIGGECLRLEWPPYSWELSKSTKHNFYKEVFCRWTTSILKLSMKGSIAVSNLPFWQRVSIL